MRDSPFREHKLEFASYLHGQSGGILLSKMAAAGNLSKDDVLSLLSEVRPLEFYMPVDRDRETWTGTPDLVVVSLLQDDGSESPVGFNLEGRAVQLSLDHPPEAPVMSLVPVETDFSEPLATASVRNIDRADGQAVGSYVPMKARASRCLECYGGGGGTTFDWSSVPAGLYLTYSSLEDTGESWTKGSPEIEVHLLAPTSGSANEADDLQCAGANVPAPDYFDQNDNVWKSSAEGGTEDPPRIATQTRLDRLTADFGSEDGPIYYVIEDNDTGCVIKTDHDNLQDLVDGAMGITAGIDAISNGQVILGVAAITRAITTDVANFVKSNDDPIGQIVESSCTGRDGNVTGFEVRHGSELIGCAELYRN